MNSEEVLKEIYKPLRVTIQGKVKVLETMTGKYVVKEKKKNNIRDVFNYLRSRNFNYFPDIIDDTRDGVNVYEYVEGIDMPSEQRALDLINLVGLLHNKTSYYKEVTQDKYKEIYDNIKSNILYLNDYYDKLFDKFLLIEFMSPSQYLFSRNYSSINNALKFCEKELDEWYDIVKKSNRQRVALLHNNLELDHYIKGDSDYLISWDDNTVDTPVWDIVKFYRKEYYEVEFSSVLNRYLNEFELREDEKKLLFILMVLPDKIDFVDNEYESTNNVRVALDYIYKTEELIRPYYTKQEEK